MIFSSGPPTPNKVHIKSERGSKTRTKMSLDLPFKREREREEKNKER